MLSIALTSCNKADTTKAPSGDITSKFTDMGFRTFMLNGYYSVWNEINGRLEGRPIDANKDGFITIDECEAMTNVFVDNRHYTVSNLNGIEYIKNTLKVEVSGNSLTGTLDLSMLEKLNSVDVSKNYSLQKLVVKQNVKTNVSNGCEVEFID